MSYPTAPVERQQRRDAIILREVEWARLDAARVGRTMTCSHPDMRAHGTCHGNIDPAICLCECHDVLVVQSTTEEPQ